MMRDTGKPLRSKKASFPLLSIAMKHTVKSHAPSGVKPVPITGIMPSSMKAKAPPADPSILGWTAPPIKV
jgi:hypothetical protein